MASHDGRFSYAALRLGAAHVTGVEGRAHLVAHAIRRQPAVAHDLDLERSVGQMVPPNCVDLVSGGAG